MKIPTWINYKHYRVYNHNNTLIGEYETLEEALKDAQNYHYQTGNAYFLEEADDDEEV